MQTLKLGNSEVSVFSKACTVVEYQNSIYFSKQMARYSYGNLSSSSLNMKMLNRWSNKLPSQLQLSWTLFYFPSNNKLTCALWDIGQTEELLLFSRQKLAELWPCYVLLDATLSTNITKSHKRRTLARCVSRSDGFPRNFYQNIYPPFSVALWNYLAVTFEYVHIRYLRKSSVPLSFVDLIRFVELAQLPNSWLSCSKHAGWCPIVT